VWHYISTGLYRLYGGILYYQNVTMFHGHAEGSFIHTLKQACQSVLHPAALQCRCLALHSYWVERSVLGVVQLYAELN